MINITISFSFSLTELKSHDQNSFIKIIYACIYRNKRVPNRIESKGEEERRQESIFYEREFKKVERYVKCVCVI